MDTGDTGSGLGTQEWTQGGDWGHRDGCSGHRNGLWEGTGDVRMDTGDTGMDPGDTKTNPGDTGMDTGDSGMDPGDTGRALGTHGWILGTEGADTRMDPGDTYTTLTTNPPPTTQTPLSPQTPLPKPPSPPHLPFSLTPLAALTRSSSPRRHRRRPEPRQHRTGSARSEGYYPISKREKARYLRPCPAPRPDPDGPDTQVSLTWDSPGQPQSPRRPSGFVKGVVRFGEVCLKNVVWFSAWKWESGERK